MIVNQPVVIDYVSTAFMGADGNFVSVCMHVYVQRLMTSHPRPQLLMTYRGLEGVKGERNPSLLRHSPRKVPAGDFAGSFVLIAVCLLL